MKRTDYHLASIAKKRAMARAEIREPAVACPFCETKTSVDVLLTHIDTRCPGRLPAHKHSRWVTRAEALKAGATSSTLWRWVKLGLVRQNFDGKYLLRDIIRLIAASRPDPALATNTEDT